MVESEQDEAQAIDPILRAEVSRIWREWIGMDPDLSVGEREAQIDTEALRLTSMVDQVVGDSPHGFLAEQWRQEHPGQEPNFPTTVALIETARRSARQKVLESELYPQLSATAAAQTERELAEISAAAAAEARRLREVRDPNRWRRSMVEVSELAERIVSRVWGTAGTFEFRMLALSLVQQRIEDNEPTPTTSADPVREELEAMIDDQIRSQTTPF